MSTVLVVTPLIIASWPAITAAITAAVGSLGFATAAGAAAATADALRSAERSRQRAEIEVEDSDILGDASATGEQLVVERDGVRAVFSRDARGNLKLCLEGGNLSKAQLTQLGEELLGRVKQQYAYHRIVEELQQRNMTIVDERVEPDQSVKIRVRNW